MKGRVIMHFLEIAGEKFGSDDLSRIAANSLTGLGIKSFQTIDIDTKHGSITIRFDDPNDIATVRAIAGSTRRSSSKKFHSNNVSQFMLELYCVMIAG